VDELKGLSEMIMTRRTASDYHRRQGRKDQRCTRETGTL
jgi:hypothetical protein